MNSKTVVATLVTVMSFSLARYHPANSYAAEPVAEDKSQQIWEGPLNVGAAVLRLRFEISRADDGSFSGNLISVDQGNAKVPLTDMSVKGDTVTMEFDSINGKFSGKRIDGKEEVVGKWTQLGKTYDYTIKRAGPEIAKEHTETWHGVLNAGKTEYDLQLRIAVDDEGNQYALLDSFSQRKLGLSAEFESTDEGFQFQLEAIKASFTGSYNDDHSEIIGEWDQIAKFPLTFKKIPIDDTRWVLAKNKRPQHPTEPFPYELEEVRFRSKADNVELAGTLTIPRVAEGNKRFPAVVLISGSGPQDRNEELMDHKPFLVIADHFTRQGIAVLRYDDRGAGESSGKFVGATTEDFSQDAEGGVDFLKEHPKIDPAHIGIVGHSEGGIIGPMIAARRDDVAFVIMLAGPGITGAEISTSQSRAMSEAAGLPASLLDTQEQALQAVIDETIRQNKPLTEDQIDAVLEKIAASSEEKSEYIKLFAAGLKNLSDPWMANYLMSDPGPALRKVSCPVLALNGEKDLQVLPDLNLPAIEKHLTAAGNKDFESVEMAGLNHLFQTAETGQMSEYVAIEETFSPTALNKMSQWILERVK